ncbi:MAG: MFS transporter [Clostridia bacterium]|nr:MFS transporter [Clostridia bacterium]
MADENLEQEHEYSDEELQYVYENRRYVGTKETVGFVLWDAAQSLNINGYATRFITNIVKIDLGYQAIVNGVNGIWDIVNDVFTAAIVEKTRTRWGKFRPYLMGLAIPGAIMTLMYWFMPLFFGGKSAMDMGKFIFFFAGEIIRQEVATFQEISRTGLLSTITPHPSDRTRLITLANFASGTFGEKLPDQIMTVLLDLIDRNVIKSSKKTTEQLLRGTFIGMGSFCTIASSAMSFWFFMNSKERIMQSIHSPSIISSFKSIINNKPVLLIALSDFLSAFGISGDRADYYIDVLKFASMKLVAGIPAAPISPVSYSYVPWMRRHFSSRFLYIVSHYISNFLYIFVFAFGCIGFNPKTFKGGLYRKTLPMFFAMATWEFIWTLFYGLRSVIGTEMYNEAMDYCEWKNGYRTEAMTSVAKQLAKKLADTVSRTITTALKKFVGYDQEAWTSGAEQPDYVKFYLFAMFTIVPAVTGSLGIIPMLFYDLNGKKKEVMYAELLERRKKASEIASEGDTDALHKFAEEQIKK